MENTIQKKQKRNIKIKQFLIAAAFVGPSVIAFFIFKYLTTFQSLFYSLFRYDYGNPPGVFIGLDNYIQTFKSALFWESVWNTIVLFFFSMIFAFWVPIAQALFLNEIPKGKGVFRYLYILPAALPGVATLSVWSYIWDVNSGLANYLVQLLGFEPQKWLFDPKQVKICLRIGGLLGGGIGMLIYLVAIQGIDSQIYEAARIDGASRICSMFRITIPNIMFIIKIQFLLNICSSLLVFDDVYIMTKGGPGTSSTTVVMTIYDKAFSALNFGQAMAMSVIVTFFTLVFVILQLRLSKAKD